MSSRRERSIEEVLDAGRANSAACVLLHASVARALGLSPGDTKAFDHVLQHGPITAGELARVLGLRNASVTALVDRLLARGLVQRERDARDRRRVLITAAPGAAGVVLRPLEPFLEGLARALEGYSASELDAIARYLRAAERLALQQAQQIGAGSDPP